MQEVGPLVAIKQLMELNGGVVCSGRELVDFKNSCTIEEFKEYATQAAATLGVALKG